MQTQAAHSTTPTALVDQTSGPRTPSRATTRWKIALNCSVVALCMLVGALLPTGALASATTEAVEFFRSYGSVIVAAMAVTTLVIADMMSWPFLTQTNHK